MEKIKIIFLVLIINFLIGQIDHEHNHEHNNEMSIAIGVVPNHEEQENNIGLHIHYIKGIGEDNDFGIGISFETILDEHKHNSMSIIGSYHFNNGFSIAYAPGILVTENEEIVVTELTQHFEFCYELEFGIFHIGPQFDIGFEKEEIHFMLGLHLGFDF